MRGKPPTFSDLMQRSGKTPALLEVERQVSISTTYRAMRGTKPERLNVAAYALAFGVTADEVEAAIERSVGRKGKRGPKAKQGAA